MSRQTFGVVVAASLIAGWILASATRPPVARSQGTPPRRPPAVTPAPPAASFEALQQRLAGRPPSPRPTRNPFEFGTRAVPRADGPAADAPSQWDAPVTAAPAPPRLHLAGVATEHTAEGTAHTAVLSDGRDVWLLRAGETLPDGTTVVRVEEDAVVLAGPTGTERVLRLR
jgi:hypothetical protein